MNFYDNTPSNNFMAPPMMNTPIPNNDLFYRLNDLENKIKKLEQRISRLENNKDNYNNYTEPDTSMYMI